MKKAFYVLGLLSFLWSVSPQMAWADGGTKLGRGMSNLLFGWFEIVNEIGNESDRHGIWIGFPSGLIRGTTFTIARVLAGAYEMVTFPLPNGSKGYEPILLPESVFKRR